MKSYKEINDEIKVPLDIEQKTLMTIQKKKVTTYSHMYRYVETLVLILILCGSAVLWNRQDSEVAYEPFHLSKYLVNELNSNEKRFNDIAGSLEPMNETLRKEVAFAPEQSGLVFPAGYVSSVEFIQYVYEDIGPYANVIYHADKGDRYQFDFTIQDKRMPSCYTYDIYELSSLNEYNGYRIAISKLIDKNGVICYWLYASRDGYNIEGSAMVEKEEDFTNFLVTFLK